MILRTYSPQLFPSVAFAGLDAMHRLLERFPVASEDASVLPAEVVQTATGASLAFEVPGIEAKDVKVEVEDRVVSVSVERRPAGPTQGTALRSERFFGTVSRSIELPFPVDAASVQAALRNGILTVSVVPVPEAKPRQIQVVQA